MTLTPKSRVVVSAIALTATLMFLASCGGGSAPPGSGLIPARGLGAETLTTPEDVSAFSMPDGSTWVRWTVPGEPWTWITAWIYRAQVADFSQATKVGEKNASGLTFYVDKDVQAGVSYHYWVQFVDDSGSPLGASARTSHVAEASVEQQIRDLSEEILNDPLYEELVTPITPFADLSPEVPDARQSALPEAETASGFLHLGADPGARVSRSLLSSYLTNDARQWPGDRLHKFVGTPTIRLHTSVPRQVIPSIGAVVDTINLYLPMDRQLSFDPRAARVNRIEPEDGEIILEFSPSSRWGAEYWRSAGLAFPYGQDSRIDSALIRLDPNKVMRVFPNTLAHELLHSLGRHHPVNPKHVTIMRNPSSGDSPPYLLHPLDAEALTAVYGKLEAGTRASSIATSLGPWEEDGEMLFGSSGFAAFGIEYRNDTARPWAYGPTPRVSLRESLGYIGSVSWEGGMVGYTPQGAPVFADTKMTLTLLSLSGSLTFSEMAHEDDTVWGDGQLDYRVRAEGNRFSRTGGDDGQLSGAFFGPRHESMGGTLRRDDLAAGFGGLRE